MVVPDKTASKLLGPLPFGPRAAGGGGVGGGGDALASDISPGKVFEKFQTQEVSSLHTPPQRPHVRLCVSAHLFGEPFQTSKPAPLKPAGVLCLGWVWGASAPTQCWCLSTAHRGAGRPGKPPSASQKPAASSLVGGGRPGTCLFMACY